MKCLQKPRYHPYPSQHRQQSRTFLSNGGESLTLPNQQQERKEFPCISSLISKVKENPFKLEVYVKPLLQFRLSSFVGGQISHCTFCKVAVYCHFYTEMPPSKYVMPTNSIAKEHNSKMEGEITNLIKRQVIVECEHV